MKRAAIYCRISDDRDGRGLGVERQREDCAALVEQNGWTLTAEPFIDNDVSATKSKPRPAYRAMMAMVAAHKVDVIVALRSDRLYRRMVDLVEFVNTVRASKTDVALVMGGDLRLDTADGRAVAYYQGVGAATEAEKTAERVQRSRVQLRATGLTQGGGRRAYGFTPNGRSVVEDEAAIIRQIAGELLAGSKLRPLVARLNAAGIKPARAGQWSTRTVKGIMNSPRIAGLLPSGEKSATYEPIISLRDFDKLQTIVKPGVAAPRQQLMCTGWLFCEDGHPMASGGNGTYTCHMPPGINMSVKAVALDAAVNAVVARGAAEWIHAREVEQAIVAAQREVEPSEPEADTYSQDRAQLLELEALWLARDIDAQTWLRLSKPLKAKIELADREADHRQHGVGVASVANLAAQWDNLDTDQRRVMLAKVVSRITVKRGRLGTRFSPDRVTVEWAS
ncbi:MAG: recombinase family protein [Candidatus Dormiibacterota bacterium]